MEKRNDSSQNKRSFLSWKYFVFIVIIIIGITSFFILKEKDYETFNIEYKEIVSGFDSKALIIRDEKIYKAPISGELNILIDEGQRVSYGEKIAFIEDEDQKYNIYSKKSGIISFAYDGLGKILKFGQITPEVLNKYDEYERNYHQYVSGNIINKGDTLYRNINNYQQYLLIKTDLETVEDYNQNEIVFVDNKQKEDDNKLIKGSIKKIYHHNDLRFLLLELNNYVSMWNNTRWVEIKVIKDIYRGLAVPSSAIFKTTTGTKVLLYTFDHEVKLKEVKVVEQTSDWAVVENLEIGDQIIINPEKANYGRDDQ